MRFLLITSIFISSLSFGIDYQYIYTDGNNNTYSLKGDTLKYNPVKKINSSSGQYDGGEIKTIKLNAGQIETLTSLFDTALKTTNIHIQQREMGCGTLAKIKPDNEQRAYLKMNAEEKIEIEKYLLQLLGK